MTLEDYDPDALKQLADSVCDETSFLTFLSGLGHDYALERQIESLHSAEPYSAGRLGWENSGLPNITEAAVAWANASPTPVQTVAAVWQRCAQILLAGKYYE